MSALDGCFTIFTPYSSVSYAMTCDDGYGFLASETEPVYGYCSGNAEGNVFTITESDGCYGIEPFSLQCVTKWH